MSLKTNYFNKKELSIILFGLILFIPSLLLRDYTPGNELKYIGIAKDMLKNGSVFVLRDLGELYSDKPPLYFWLINASKAVTGGYHIWAIGLFSAIPSIAIAVIMYRWGKKHIGEKNSFLASLMLITTIFYFGASVVLRMDMLMALFILLSLYSFFLYYEDPVKNLGKKNWIYIYVALAVFTKGPAGLIIPLVAILAFLALEKNLKFLKELSLIRGLALILAFFLVWFTLLIREGGKEYLYLLTVKQTVGRGVNAFAHKRPFYYYLANIWGNTFPWPFIYMGSIGYGSFKFKKLNTFERFMFSAIVSTILVFSSFSSKLDIYLIPIYPFFPFLAMGILEKLEKSRKKFSWVTLGLVQTIFSLSFIAIFFLPQSIEGVSIDLLVKSMLIAISVLGIFGLISLKKSRYKDSMISMVVTMSVAILTLSAKVPEINPEIGLGRVASEIQNFQASNKVDEIVVYNYRSGVYLGVYLDERVKLFRDKQAFKNYVNQRENLMVLTRTKDMKKLNEILDVSAKSQEVYRNNSYVLLL